jgi:hypothetical protein
MSEDVEVIFYAIDLVKVTLFIVQDSPDVCKKLFAVGGGQYGRSVFCAEHNLIEYLSVGAHSFC